MLFYTLKQFNRESEENLSKIKEKNLKSIKSDMEEIKEFIISNNDFDNSEQNKSDYLNNDEDTLTLTKIVQDDTNSYNINDLGEVKKDLLELKKAIETNKNLLKEILSRIK